MAGARLYGARAVVVDAIDDRAAEFYRHHGFLASATSPKPYRANFARIVARPCGSTAMETSVWSMFQAFEHPVNNDRAGHVIDHLFTSGRTYLAISEVTPTYLARNQG